MPRQKPVEVPCSHCGKSFTKYASQLAPYKNHFCSSECYHAYRVGREVPNAQRALQLRCTQCGRTFRRGPAKTNRSETKFCSHACYAAWREGRFSGSESPRWSGGHIKSYGSDWLEQRRKARKRDSYKCQHCGISERRLGKELDVHHLTPFRRFGIKRHKEANQLSNLISLCPSCHQNAEHGNIAIQPKLL